MANSNLSAEEKVRYMDNIRVWMRNIRLGWRWMKDELVFMESWRKEEQEVGMTGLQKTLEA